MVEKLFNGAATAKGALVIAPVKVMLQHPVWTLKKKFSPKSAIKLNSYGRWNLNKKFSQGYILKYSYCIYRKYRVCFLYKYISLMNFLYQRKLMSTCFPGKSGEANPTQKPVVSEKQVSYNVGGSYLNTELKNAVKAADLKAQYDARVKRLVGHKRILAQILTKTVDEFKGMNPKAVADCIEGTPYISAVPVEPGLTNAVLDRNGQRIVGFNTENQEINEGLARFDIVFYVRTKDGLSQIIINVEAQKDEPGEYEILNRAIFYVSRLVSSQKERDFENSSYNDIKRVYSIWICMNMEENTMSHIHLTKEDLIGSYEWKGNLDLINIVMIGLAKELPEHDETYELHRLLGALLSQELTVDEKLSIIGNEYDIPIEENMRKDVSAMCNLGEGIEEKGIAIGRETGRIEGEAGLILKMHKNGLSAEQIASATDKEIEEVKAIIAGRI